jgi:hypothetical protein
MPPSQIEVRDGPDKPGLLRAVANPDAHLHVSFDTDAGLIEAHMDGIEELGLGGARFTLRGHIASGNLKGAIFAGTYDCETRSGVVVLKQAR